jgi:AP endonuclease-1
MPTKVSREVDIEVADVQVAEITNTTPKKGRRATKVEHKVERIEAEVVAKAGRSTPKRSATQKVKYEDASDDEIIASSKSAVKAKKTSSNKKGAATANKKVSAKRKLKEEDEDEDDEEEEELEKITVEKKVVKKRKTKEEKEAESMPLAERTLVTTLKKAMHIGAHVSGAGGMSLILESSISSDILL